MDEPPIFHRRVGAIVVGKQKRVFMPNYAYVVRQLDRRFEHYCGGKEGSEKVRRRRNEEEKKKGKVAQQMALVKSSSVPVMCFFFLLLVERKCRAPSSQAAP